MDYFNYLADAVRAEGRQMLSTPVPQPKPKADPNKRRRTHKRRMDAFRDAVWARESDEHGWAHCGVCGGIVKRGSEFFGGEVHHRLHRSTHPELRYTPEVGMVTCRDCHRGIHSGRISL